MGKGRSYDNGFGRVTHYDDKGHKTGYSQENIFGGYTNYDASGHKVGRSEEQLFGTGYNHYDASGHKIGHSDRDAFGGYRHYDASGHRTGTTYNNGLGSYKNTNDEGCYVATCVYGSYDCPEVWTLRRFRDNTLAASRLGRAFIKLYYAVSPTIVKKYGKTTWFKQFWKSILDKLVHRLNRKGVEDTPYKDRNWR